MQGLCNKVSDPMNLRHRLAYITKDTIRTYTHILCVIQETKLRYFNYKMQNRIFKVLLSLCTAKSKNKSDTFI